MATPVVEISNESLEIKDFHPRLSYVNLKVV